MFFVLPSSQFKEILKVVYQSEETCVFPFTSSALSYFTFKFPLLLYKHLAIALLHTFKQCILSLLKKTVCRCVNNRYGDEMYQHL